MNIKIDANDEIIPQLSGLDTPELSAKKNYDEHNILINKKLFFTCIKKKKT